MKKVLLSVLSLITALTTFAQQPKENALLWKIEGKNTTVPSYLYGTFHMLCPTDFNMNDKLKALVKQSKQMFLEIDIDDPSLTAKMMKHIKMKDGKTLKDFLSPADYDSVAKLFQEKTHIPLNMVDTYKPFMLTSMLYPALLGCTPIAFEKEFEKLAKADSIEIKGLETIEDQMNVFETIPYSAQAKMLKKTLFEGDNGKEQMNEMVSLYKKQDINAMQKDITGDTDLGSYEKTLLDKRNKNWIPVIEKEIAVMPTFIAVGAGHLAGKKGVIYLLRKQGYKVTPISF
jgi:hypothetical protein